MTMEWVVCVHNSKERSVEKRAHYINCVSIVHICHRSIQSILSSKQEISLVYRVSNKFSDTFNELFVVNWLISHFFCDNTKWKVVTSPHYLKILLKSTKHGLSYNLKRDWKSISKITFVGGFVLALVIQNLKNFSQKQLF